MVEKIEAFLASPLEKGERHFKDSSKHYLQMLQERLLKEGSDRQSLGRLIGRLKALEKQIQNLEILSEISIEKGSLSIGHKPSKKLLSDLKLQGYTHILTLLSQKEKITELKKSILNKGFEWIWFPLEDAKLFDTSRVVSAKDMFKELDDLLKEGAKVYIHCSAGIHRTGMVAYGFLLYKTRSKTVAKEYLKKLREETYLHMGEQRVLSIESHFLKDGDA